MYENQEQLQAMAEMAKQRLASQQSGENNKAPISYEGLGVYDDEVPPAPQVTDNQPQQQYNTEEIDDEKVMDRIKQVPPTLDSYDDVLFPGGPTKSQIQAWKKEWDGYDIYVTEILNQTFVFRTLNRFEYKQLVSFIDINALQREETICNTVTLWPLEYSFEEMATGKAGIPSTYSEIIMEKSGFTKDFAIQEI